MSQLAVYLILLSVGFAYGLARLPRTLCFAVPAVVSPLPWIDGAYWDSGHALQATLTTFTLLFLTSWLGHMAGSRLQAKKKHSLA